MTAAAAAAAAAGRPTLTSPLVLIETVVNYHRIS